MKVNAVELFMLKSINEKVDELADTAIRGTKDEGVMERLSREKREIKERIQLLLDSIEKPSKQI